MAGSAAEADAQVLEMVQHLRPLPLKAFEAVLRSVIVPTERVSELARWERNDQANENNKRRSTIATRETRSRPTSIPSPCPSRQRVARRVARSALALLRPQVKEIWRNLYLRKRWGRSDAFRAGLRALADPAALPAWSEVVEVFGLKRPPPAEWQRACLRPPLRRRIVPLNPRRGR